jgi:mono/diheme cytochrome c family protein
MIRVLPFAVLVLGAALAVPAAPPPPPSPSYTLQQANRGQILFYENCAECHGASLEGNFGPALAGSAANIQWDTVTYVWTYMHQHMPAGDAGGLREDEYLSIMAFIMKNHGDAAGRKPLTSKAAAASQALLGP